MTIERREIKFRIWIKAEDGYPGRMVFPVWTGLPLDEDHTFEFEENGQRNEYLCTEGFFMQFTGLHDKNGKEIYEGDILLSLGWNEKTKEIDKKMYSVVEWKPFISGFFPFADYDVDCDGYPRESYSEAYQVIGNIYENPNLIPPVRTGEE